VVEITLGTAGVPLCFSGRVVSDPRMRIMCCAHAAPGRWSLEGLQKSAGASLAWVAQITGAGDPLEPGFSRAAAGVEPGAGGVLFYPYLDGPSAPHWYAGATGMLVGLASSHRAPELLRAVMEGVALETRETLAVFAALGAPARDVRLTGGYTRVRVWNQIYADVLGRPVSTLAVPQATLLGAAMLAACGAGMHRSAPAAARAMVRLRETLAPDPESAGRYDAVFRRHREVGRMVHEAGVFGRIRGRD
jgi:xylulokinase